MLLTGTNGAGKAVVSLYTKDGSQIEIGTIGREGMSAFPLLMGVASTANDGYCQVRGSAVTIGAKQFRELRSMNSGFRRLLERYLQAYVNMLGQIAACNRLHGVYERCARWLALNDPRSGQFRRDSVNSRISSDDARNRTLQRDDSGPTWP